MADEQQHTDRNNLVETDPLTGLNIVSNDSINSSASNRSLEFAEADSNSISKLTSNLSVNSKPKSPADPKRVSIAETNEEEGGSDGNRNLALPGVEDDGERLDKDNGGSDMPIGLGEKKKKKKKRKPKSQRGLV